VQGYEYMIDPANLEASLKACQWLMYITLVLYGLCALVIVYSYFSKSVVFTANSACFVVGAVIILASSWLIKGWQDEAKETLLADFSQSCVDVQADAEFINLSKTDLAE